MNGKTGDRVRLKEAAVHRGERGIVERSHRGRLLVRLEKGGRLIELTPHQVTNFSLAARKAWESMPDRRVGRPKGSRVCDRLSVTLRIDRDLWKDFRAMESDGRIQDRTTLVNALLRKKLAELKSKKAGANA
ncbi:MAG: hypothetical protein DME24_21180 [Verrucomicrobia bacterium]|nr:MAG: hypothetical protein DME24_21180 [Verrucomicrobiota bacterium]